MTDRIEKLHMFIRSGGHHPYRRTVEYADAEQFANDKLSHMERVTRGLEQVLAREQPLVLEGERILFWRTVQNLPAILTEQEWADIRADHFIHELGRVSNLSPDYASILAVGLLPARQRAEEGLSTAGEERREQRQFYCSVIRSIDALLGLTASYRKAALEAGNTEAAAVLERVPARGARTFREALQSLRIVHYAMWCEGNYHNTLGRFDQYLFHYLQADLAADRVNRDEAYELLEEFFLSLNRDSDLYPGIQQVDNGQSMMLGGVDRDGVACFNELSEMCLDASRELKLIDPKINLRVDKNTPLRVYEKGTLLTREGLGFPQYSNDDVVIPGLVAKGYELADARDYAVAACWEFIIPGKGMDIPNIAAVNFPGLVSDTVMEDLDGAESYDAFFARLVKRLEQTCRELCDEARRAYFLPAPFLSLFMDGCLASATSCRSSATTTTKWITSQPG